MKAWNIQSTAFPALALPHLPPVEAGVEAAGGVGDKVAPDVGGVGGEDVGLELTGRPLLRQLLGVEGAGERAGQDHTDRHPGWHSSSLWLARQTLDAAGRLEAASKTGPTTQT